MLPCVAFACQRLATAPADTHMAHMLWSWAEMVMERVTRGRVKRVQVRLRADRVPSTGHRACRYVRDVQDYGALGCVDNGACDAGSREESAGAAAAARVLCCVLRLSCKCLRALCVDARCMIRWLVLRCVAAHRSGCIKRAVAFILVCRLLLPPALQADATLWGRQPSETAFRCFAM